VKTTLTRTEGHAHVAAVRVLDYRQGRPPSLEEVAEVLGSKIEITAHRLRALQELGIVKLVESPFAVHVHVTNYPALEELPEEQTGEDLAEQMKDFQRRQEEKAQEFQRIFAEEDPNEAHKEKFSKLEDDLRHFKKKKSKKAPWEKDGEG
jgi:hypothetical protein